MRWATGETRNAVFWLGDNDDAPATGLTPTVTALRVSDGAAAGTPAVTELSLGFYRFSFTAPAAGGYVFLADAGATLDNAHRYVPLEVPVGGYVDNADATTTSRSSQGSVDALGTLLVALVDDLETRLSAARGLLLDNLANLDVAVSTRATPADVDVDVTVTQPIDAVVEVS